jgi:hypothetical protein
LRRCTFSTTPGVRASTDLAKSPVAPVGSASAERGAANANATAHASNVSAALIRIVFLAYRLRNLCLKERAREDMVPHESAERISAQKRGGLHIGTSEQQNVNAKLRRLG